MQEKIYIYCIYFPTSNKYYVGQTNNIERRMQDHLRSGRLVCNALWKFNNWKITILHTCKNRDLANQLEIEDIRNLNCVAPNGYNLTHGGENPPDFTGHKHSEEAKAKMGVNRGKKFSDEHKKKLSESHKGHKHSEEHKKKIGQASRGRQAHLGCKHSKETKKRMQISQLKRRIREMEQGGVV